MPGKEASTSRTVPPLPWGIGKGFYSQGSWSEVGNKAQSNEGLAFFSFSSVNSRPKLVSGGSAPGSGVPEVFGL